MAWYPIDEILALVQTAPDATSGWDRLRTLCEQHWPSPLWGHLRGVDPVRDAEDAASWLRAQLDAASAAEVALRGLYLGLDTLNMDGPQGANVEIAGTSTAQAVRLDPTAENIEWVHRVEWDGDRHLIAGLRAMKEVYARSEWQAQYGAADYVLFLGYSGVVLADAAASVQWPQSVVLVWGFHDGDLFRLGRWGRDGFERLVARGQYSAEYLDAAREKARVLLEEFKRQNPELFR